MLSIPMRSVAGVKRGREELERDATAALRQGGVPAPVIAALLSARDEAELEVLEQSGLTQVGRAPAHTPPIGDLPAAPAAATHRVYKRRRQGAFDFVFKPLP